MMDERLLMENLTESQNKAVWHKDGSLLVETTLCHDMEVIPAVLQWIPHVRVIKPEGLAKEIKESVKEYLKGL